MTATEAVRRPLDLSAFVHVKDDGLRLLLRHWLAKRGDRLVPLRTAIDPAELGPILASIWLCDFLPGERRFRMRLSGEDIKQLCGRNINQCLFEEIIAPHLLADILRRYRGVVEQPAVLHCAGQIYLASERSVVGERLVLPLADDSGAILHLIGASVFGRMSGGSKGPITRESMTETFTPLLGR